VYLKLEGKYVTFNQILGKVIIIFTVIKYREKLTCTLKGTC